MKKIICKNILRVAALLICASGESLATYNDYIDWLTTNAPSAQAVTTGLTSGIKNVGECALTAGESLSSCKQYTAEELTKAWSSFPRETQQVILGGAVLATAAYNTPKLYRYLTNSLTSRRDDILDQAKGISFIHDAAPLAILQSLFPGQNNLYTTVLARFNFNPNQPQKERGELLFFKYLKALIEDRIYAIKENIQHQLSLGTMAKSTFMQRWITGRSDNPYQQLHQLISFNKELADIVTQLEKEINTELKIY